MAFSPLFLVLALIVPAAAILAMRIFPNARIFWLLRRGPERAGKRSRDLDVAAAYQARSARDAGGTGLDDRAWRDLDLDAVFLALDRSESLPGQQYLYHPLHAPHATSAPLVRMKRPARGHGNVG